MIHHLPFHFLRLFAGCCMGVVCSSTALVALNGCGEDGCGAAADVSYRMQGADSLRTYQKDAGEKIPWHLDRIDQSSTKLDGEFTPFCTGLGVTIYILDTGIRYTHEAFGDRVAPFEGGVNGDFVGDEWGSTNGALDCHGHGTHVAAVAAGKTFGVASGAEVRAVRVGDCKGRGNPDVAVNAIEEVTRSAVKPTVVLISLDYGDVESVRNAVEASIAKGIIVVAAAGGSLRDACLTSPGGAYGVIAVAATNEQDEPLTFNNFGPCVDMFAPGEHILSADMKGDQSMKVRRGSSMAAALTAGAAALVLEKFPEASPYDVERILTSYALLQVGNLISK
jgi:subtilisin family serine protease